MRSSDSFGQGHLIESKACTDSSVSVPENEEGNISLSQVTIHLDPKGFGGYCRCYGIRLPRKQYPWRREQGCRNEKGGTERPALGRGCSPALGEVRRKSWIVG